MKKVTIEVSEKDLDLLEDLFSSEITEDESKLCIDAVKRLWQSIVDAD